MRKINKILISATAILSLLVISCENFLDPDLENRITYEDAINNPVFAEGWLLKAYKNLPTNYNFDIDVASDDAATNDVSSNIKVMNNGGWASNQNPLSQWSKAYEMNLYLNTLLENVDKVTWFPSSESKDALFRNRIKGEAHALRAWWNFVLLQNHSGKGSNGEYLGFPIVDHVIVAGENVELPRNTFKECVDFIIADCNIAISNLPARWEDQGDTEVDAVLGARNLNRISGLAAMVLKSRVALYAASPSYSASGSVTWQEAATYAAEVITANGGLNLSSSDVTFYDNFQSKEIFWSSTRISNKKDWEEANLPPSLFGKGETNPSQNFVDAFGMADGTPINESLSYNPNNPYNQRDPRLSKYVIYNNQIFSGKAIKTYVNSGIDGLNNLATSTVTGYYIKKFMDQNVKLDPSGSITGRDHFYTYARFTEALLNFAEAANEAVGPDNMVSGYSAKQIVNAIRQRGGINSTVYVDGISSKEDMRTLIRNERRIELSFEGFRFWDIRRWGLTDVMNQNVMGMRISEDQTTFTPFNVSPRIYSSYQIYGPIPLSETQKYPLIQNMGW
ncbi:RagB/SusD family nutrient uptake outer membrane protein [Lutibacter sp. HS1-25]|uniref:RagB/SusD family nutrient uptake outer membrane protein n=1 Tax=Lutibacter sp. HS1-25 TaxID=2485000 RepID=UPI0010116A1F|nr:RagB/SusD family nutrient uptake outer membrane protein [Lutibacter sp. HS1-25]RXP62707.1 RagB/SusD family nutrient uptake outer membrane protein [Lutibacter sp. HS1-25]